ncbi:MAG: tetratricopeptide repeat protein [Bacteroidota bacterium]
MKNSTLVAVLLVSIASSAITQDQSQNMFRLAQAFEQQGDHERALQIYSDLFKGDSNNYVYFDAVRRTNVQLKKYQAAIAVSLNRLKKTPADFSLHSNIGSLYSMAGSEAQADSVWDSVLSSAKKNQMYYRTVANEQMNQRLFDKAISTYQRGRFEIGDQALFANELGYLYSFMMDYANSAREYLRMLRQNEQQYDFVQSRLAALVSRIDALKSVTAVIEEELVQKQSIPMLRIQMWLYMEANRYSDAFLVAQKIDKLVSSNGQELFAFAERTFRENEFRTAAAAYQQSLAVAVKSQFIPAARYGYARCIEEMSQLGQIVDESVKGSISSLETRPSFSGAVNLYESLVKEFPYSAIGANSLYRIGWIRYKQLFDLDGALQVFDSVLAVTPAGAIVPTVLSTIGDIFIAQNKLTDAAKKFRQLSSSPYANQDQKTLAQFRLAEIEFFEDNFDSSLVVLRPLTENLKADESNDALILQYFITENIAQYPQAVKQFSSAELLARQFKLSEAVSEFASIIDVYPAAPLADDALLKVAEYSIQLKKFPEALAAYLKLLDDYKESIEKDKTQFRIGELYHYYFMDKQKAIAAYEVILEDYPNSLFSDEARKRIRQLRGDSI